MEGIGPYTEPIIRRSGGGRMALRALPPSPTPCPTSCHFLPYFLVYFLVTRRPFDQQLRCPRRGELDRRVDQDRCAVHAVVSKVAERAIGLVEWVGGG